MLLDQKTLNVIEQKLINKCSLFNIQVLLQTLQLITRPLNYPRNYEEEIDDSFYLHRITQKLNDAKKSSNKQPKYVYLFQVLSRLVFCCYYIDSIREELQEDKELLSELKKAVDMRIYTSAEERCAEKTLLMAVINKSHEIMSICHEYKHNLNYAFIQQELKQRIEFLEETQKDEDPKDAEIPSTIERFKEAMTAAASDRLNDLGCALRGYANSFFLPKNEHSQIKMPMDTARLESSNSLITIESSDSLITLESSDSFIINNEYFSDDNSCDEYSYDELDERLLASNDL